MKKQRNAVFDIAKFLAIILVVLGHLMNECVGDPTFLINYFHMPVLFFLSGYFAVFSIQKRTHGEIAIKKVKTLLVPYLFWSGVSLVANTAISALGGSVTMESILEEFVQIFLYARSVWFLAELFVSFLIFLGVHKLLKLWGKERYALVAHCAVWLGLSVFVPGDLFAFYKFKWLYPFFVIGYCVGAHNEKLSAWLMEKKRQQICQVLSLLFPLLVFVFLREDAFWAYTRFEYTGIGSVLYGILYYCISAVGVAFMITLSHWLSKTRLCGICAEIGTYSMDIYVIHMFIVKAVQLVLPVDTQNLLTAYCLFSIISLVTVLVIFIISKTILRKVSLYRRVVGM